MARAIDQVTRTTRADEAVGHSELADYWTLLKPNVMKLVVFTGGVGLFIAPGSIHPLIAFVAILAMAVGAGASAAINNAYDSDIDRVMVRTRRRPTASGRIAPAEALTTGITLAIVSIALMGLAVNWLAAGLLALTIGFYVVVYTLWLKRRTPQNIVIGGAAGAAATRRQILGYAVVLAVTSLLPSLVGTAGWLYAAAALGLSGWLLRDAWQLYRTPSDRLAMRLFKVSIGYLFALFTAILVDHLVMTWSGA